VRAQVVADDGVAQPEPGGFRSPHPAIQVGAGDQDDGGTLSLDVVRDTGVRASRTHVSPLHERDYRRRNGQSHRVRAASVNALMAPPRSP